MCKKEIEDKKTYIINSSKKFTRFEHIEIFKILKKKNIKYSENSNGIFVNLNYLENNILDHIFNFIYFCASNKEKLNDEFQKREKIKQIMNQTSPKNCITKKIFEEKNIENNYNELINDDYDINVDNNETYYKENIFVIPQLKK
tara:strand:- start:120 stop:551 length:432 start_codon:yes stop_codon:yes gene_type:complete